MRGSHSLFSRQRTSSVERELASTPYAFTPKPVHRQEDDSIKRARESLLNPFEDDINVRLAKQRLFGQQQRDPERPPSPTIFPSTEDFGKRLNKQPIFDSDALSNASEVSSVRTVLSRVNSEDVVSEGLARYRRSRALAEGYVDRFYRSLTADSTEETQQGETVPPASERTSRDRSTSLDSDPVVGSVAAEAFTVLPVVARSNDLEDLESTSSTPSSFKWVLSISFLSFPWAFSFHSQWPFNSCTRSATSLKSLYLFIFLSHILSFIRLKTNNISYVCTTLKYDNNMSMDIYIYLYTLSVFSRIWIILSTLSIYCFCDF